MIVYNVKRKWFTLKNDAERYRIAEGLTPEHTLTIEVDGRMRLAALLNALCEPPLPGQRVEQAVVATPELIDRAYVPADRDIPDYIPKFLLKDWGLERKEQ